MYIISISIHDYSINLRNEAPCNENRYEFTVIDNGGRTMVCCVQTGKTKIPSPRQKFLPPKIPSPLCSNRQDKN